MRPEELTPRQAARAVDADTLAELVEQEFAVIGRRLLRTDGMDKATGREVYTDDLALPGMLHGRILRSPHAHARILSIDASEAEAMEGVRAVITGRDMPEKYCIIPWTRDEEALCVDKVRFIGDAVAGVGGRGAG
jgi:4-hydroxybenzoyl-CoA reductase subunit alpha